MNDGVSRESIFQFARYAIDIRFVGDVIKPDDYETPVF